MVRPCHHLLPGLTRLLSSPSFIFFSVESESSRGRLRASLPLGMLRAISAWGVPRSTSRVVIWAWNSKDAGCFRTFNRCNLRFLRTLLTWDLASVGGKLAARKVQELYAVDRAPGALPTWLPKPQLEQWWQASPSRAPSLSDLLYGLPPVQGDIPLRGLPQY